MAGEADSSLHGNIRMPLALAGVRIIDFTWVTAGPQCTQVLADFGAEVIKVEPPNNPGARAAVTWNNLNRNKRAITLNMRHPDAREIALSLIAKSDVVVENFTPGVLESWGLSWEAMKEANERLVYLSMTGFGWDGPNAQYVVFGPIMQAASGIAAMTGRPGRTPSTIGFSYADHIGGYFGALSILSALHECAVSGKGIMIDMSQVEASIAITSAAILDYQVNSRPFCGWGNVPFGSSDAPAGLFKCAGTDQWCAISVRTDDQWGAFTKATGLRELGDDERLATAVGRAAHRDLLDAKISAWSRQRRRDSVVDLLSDAGVPASPMLRVDELTQHPALRQHGSYETAEHEMFGEGQAQMGGVRSDFGPELRTVAPEVGEANSYVYGDILGMSDSEIVARRDLGII